MDYLEFPEKYVCCRCNVKEVKLWRFYEPHSEYIQLMCYECGEKDQDRTLNFDKSDSIGWLVPAIPLDGQCLRYYPYMNCPPNAVDWWTSLPLSKNKSNNMQEKEETQTEITIPQEIEDVLSNLDSLITTSKLRLKGYSNTIHKETKKSVRDMYRNQETYENGLMLGLQYAARVIRVKYNISQVTEDDKYDSLTGLIDRIISHMDKK